MARVNFNETDNYNKATASPWLSLKNDGDSALVQFPFDKLEDIEFQSVHKCKAISSTGKSYDAMVSCLRQRYEDPLDVCPLCNSGDTPTVPYLIPVIDYMTGTAKVWSRNKTFIKELDYNIQNTPNFRNTVFKIVRIGAKGDKNTSYKLYPQTQMQPKDFSNVQPLSLVGSVVKNLNYQDMMLYLQTGQFPVNDTDNVQPANNQYASQVPQQPMQASPLPFQPVSQQPHQDPLPFQPVQPQIQPQPQQPIQPNRSNIHPNMSNIQPSTNGSELW